MIEWFGTDHRVSLDERERYIEYIKPLCYGYYVYIQTCNRVELYRGDGLCNRSTVEHLFRVVCGLESALIGEAHIQGQIKRSYAESIENEHVSKGLHKLFQAALRCGKRVRTETKISEGAVSHSHAAVIALKNEIEPYTNKSILVIGINEITNRFIRFLNHSTGSYKITICNRTDEKAITFAKNMKIQYLQFSELALEIVGYDAVVTATSSDSYIIHDHWFSELSKLPVLIDCAVPRDIDPILAKRTKLYNLTDLENIVTHSIKKRVTQIKYAEDIISQEINMYLESNEQVK